MRLLTTCVVKLVQLIDMTRCASYDASAMTNSAANVHILDCVSFEQSVWCSFEMGDKYSTKVQGERGLHLRVLSSSRMYRSGCWTCALTVNRRQRRTQKCETMRVVLLFRTLATSALATFRWRQKRWRIGHQLEQRRRREYANDNISLHDGLMNGIGSKVKTDSNNDRLCARRKPCIA